VDKKKKYKNRKAIWVEYTFEQKHPFINEGRSQQIIENSETTNPSKKESFNKIIQLI